MSNNYEDYEPSGATEYSGASGIHYSIKYGCLCRVSKEEQTEPGWVKKLLPQEDGSILTRWYRPAKLEGWITDIVWYDREHQGKPYSGYKMTLTAKGQNYIIDWPWNSRATNRLLMTALAIDYTKPLAVNAFTGREGDLVVTFNQLGEKVPQYFKKGDMGDCPEPVEYMEMGKKKWDWKETNLYLWNMMNDRIIPHVKRTALERGLASQPAGEVADDQYTGQPAQAATNAPSPIGEAHAAMAAPAAPVAAPVATVPSAPPATAASGDDDIPF